jgi:hypothetical protein
LDHTVDVTSTEQISQWYLVPASVPREAVFFRITPIDHESLSSSAVSNAASNEKITLFHNCTGSPQIARLENLRSNRGWGCRYSRSEGGNGYLRSRVEIRGEEASGKQGWERGIKAAQETGYAESTMGRRELVELVD